MKTGKYKFIGENGSMGLTKGRTYKLNVNTPSLLWKIRLLMPLHWRVVAYRPNRPQGSVMPYTSWRKFKQNWQEVSSEA